MSEKTAPQPVLIRARIERPDGWKIPLDNAVYHFQPRPDLGVPYRHVALVADKAHIRRFLAITEGFELFLEELVFEEPAAAPPTHPSWGPGTQESVQESNPASPATPNPEITPDGQTTSDGDDTPPSGDDDAGGDADVDADDPDASDVAATGTTAADEGGGGDVDDVDADPKLVETGPAPLNDQSDDELRATYLALNGRAAHHNIKRETLINKIEDLRNPA